MKKKIILSALLIILSIFMASLVSNIHDLAKFSLWSLWLSSIMIFVIPRKNLFTKRKYLLIIPIILFGILLGASPSPMESIGRLISSFGKSPKPILIIYFLIFTLFSLFGAKFICSWGCQLGALQESLHNTPVFKTKYKWQVPFAVSLSIRSLLFIASLCLTFGWIFKIKGYPLYYNISYFPIYNLGLRPFALTGLPIFLILCLLTYRPFCSYICPFGLYAWILERFSFNKININDSKCVNCKKCTKICPTESMKGLYNKERKYLLPDCWACGKCIENCHVNAINFD
ncbi:MAG: 4Fe-4S binding protein [bacterium]